MTTSPFILILNNSFMVFLHLLIFFYFFHKLCVSDAAVLFPHFCHFFPSHTTISPHLIPKVLYLKVLPTKMDLVESGWLLRRGRTSDSTTQSTRRVASATFWRTFHHDG
jgi:hypothetical protein